MFIKVVCFLKYFYFSLLKTQARFIQDVHFLCFLLFQNPANSTDSQSAATSTETKGQSEIQVANSDSPSASDETSDIKTETKDSTETTDTKLDNADGSEVWI